jgi:hypothetical protein
LWKLRKNKQNKANKSKAIKAKGRIIERWKEKTEEGRRGNKK